VGCGEDEQGSYGGALESATEEGNAVEKAIFPMALHIGFGWDRGRVV